jgi:Flp pilus assembly protein TadD
MENTVVPVSAEETEAMLLDKLEKRQEEVEEVVLELVALYAQTERQPLALVYVERLLAATEAPGKRALLHLMLGRLMEQINDYGAAIEVYTNGLALEPTDQECWYFLNNNLGYCLNLGDRYAEAEARCRTAIQVDPVRHNAYKNLGVALEGQDRLAEAARAFLAAARLCPADPRSLRHLDDLLRLHPELIPLPEPGRGSREDTKEDSVCASAKHPELN